MLDTSSNILCVSTHHFYILRLGQSQSPWGKMSSLRTGGLDALNLEFVQTPLRRSNGTYIHCITEHGDTKAHPRMQCPGNEWLVLIPTTGGAEDGYGRKVSKYCKYPPLHLFTKLQKGLRLPCPTVSTCRSISTLRKCKYTIDDCPASPPNKDLYASSD